MIELTEVLVIIALIVVLHQETLIFAKLDIFDLKDQLFQNKFLQVKELMSQLQVNLQLLIEMKVHTILILHKLVELIVQPDFIE